VRTITALVRRELGVYFASPMAYIILTGVMLVFGLVFWSETKRASDFTMPFTFSSSLMSFAGLMTFVTPLITMRLVAEEKNRGTIETLMTAPVTELQVAVAKFASAMLFLFYLLLPTVAHAILISKYGTIDVSETLTGYLGLILLCGSLFSIGLFISAVSDSQVTAGVITFVTTFLLLLTSVLAGQIREDSWWGKPMKSVVQTLDPFKYLEDFLKGIVDTRPLVYFLSLIVFFLFLSVRALESRRWR